MGLAVGVGAAGGRALAGAWASTGLVVVEWWGLVDPVDPVSEMRTMVVA